MLPMRARLSWLTEKYLMRQTPLRRWLICWALLSFVGLDFALSYYLLRKFNGLPVTVMAAFINQMLRFQIWAGFVPLIIGLDRLVGRRFPRWIAVLFFHFPGAVVTSLLHTLVLGLLYWPLRGWGYDNFVTMRELYYAITLTNMVVGIVIYKVILTTFYALDYYEQYQVERQRAEGLEQQLASAQLQALRMQLQPHFLFNALNSISSLVLEEPRAAVRMISQLGDFLRQTIDHQADQEVTLERELEFIRLYLNIEQVRFRDRLTVNFSVAEAVLQAKVPWLVLQPIIENAIKHGISQRMAPGRIEIRAFRQHDRLQISVSDDGPGISKIGQRNGKEGIGLVNTRERLQQLYQDDFRLELAGTTGRGTIVLLEIPFVQSARKNEAAAMGVHHG